MWLLDKKSETVNRFAFFVHKQHILAHLQHRVSNIFQLLVGELGVDWECHHNNFHLFFIPNKKYCIFATD